MPAGEKETESLRQTCLNVKGIKTVKELKARKSGPFLFVEVSVGVLGTISASAAHRFRLTSFVIGRHCVVCVCMFVCLYVYT